MTKPFALTVSERAEHDPAFRQSLEKARRPYRTKYRTEDYVGRRFGKRIVTRDGQLTKSGCRQWVMKCDCGDEKAVTVAMIVSGRGVQCLSCQKRSQSNEGHPSWTGCGSISGSFYASIRASAKKRKIPLLVSMQYLSRLWNDQGGICALSGLPMTIKRNSAYPSNCSLDRIDSGLPYAEGNVQFVLVEVNIGKQSMSVERYVEVCTAVARRSAQL